MDRQVSFSKVTNYISDLGQPSPASPFPICLLSISLSRLSHLLPPLSPGCFMGWLRAVLPSPFKVLTHVENIWFSEENTSCPSTTGPLRAEGAASQHLDPFWACQQQKGGDLLLIEWTQNHPIHTLKTLSCISMAGKETNTILVLATDKGTCRPSSFWEKCEECLCWEYCQSFSKNGRYCA